MSKINFLSVDITGFRTIVKPLHFDLNRSGLNMIKGVNGAGKTSVFEALIWALYGTNLKDVNQAQLISWPENRGSLWQGTGVSVVFQIENSTYCITRCLGYKGLVGDVKGEDGLFVQKDGVFENKDRNKDLTQQSINQLLGINANVFINSILFGQRMSKLVQQSGSDKRELFETLFATEWIVDCKTKCDADLTQLSLALNKLSTDINISLTSIEHFTDKLSTAKETLVGFEASRTVRYTAAIEDLNTHKTKLGEFEAEIISYGKFKDVINYDAEVHSKLEEQFNALEKQFNEANLAQVTHNNKLTIAQNLVTNKKTEVTRTGLELKKLTDKHIEGNCPYCEQELRDGNKLEINHNIEIISATGKVQNADVLLKEAEKALKALQKIKAPATPESITTAKEAIEEQLVAMDAQLVEYNTQVENIKEATTDKTQAEKDIVRITKTVGDIKAEKPPVVSLDGIGFALEAEKLKLEELQNQKPVIEKKLAIAEWWSKKALSSSGLKSYIFSSMLTMLNQKVKKYGDRLGASLEFSIDLTKASKPFVTICSLGDKLNKDYNSFSGGEKQRLDLCLMFAMTELVSMGSDINILILDEALENLDEAGEAAAFEIIRSIADTGKSIYLVTHSQIVDYLY
jgi:DNA repair exonuclease SbcCD ATPase subunit